MKNLIFLTTLGVFLFTSCSKDEINEPVADQAVDSVYIMKQVEDQTILEATSIETIQRELTGTPVKMAGRTMTTNGYYTNGLRDIATITWAGTQTERDVTGSATVYISTPTQTLHFILKTVCVNVVGNEAVYGGEVTRVIEANGEGRFLEKGWHFYFKVIDYNGVSRSEVDKISRARVFSAPGSPSFCGLDVRSPLWASHGYDKILSPGFAVVE